MWIMVSGPYRSAARDAAGRRANLRAMNEAALRLFRAGHVPVVGVDLAVPLIELADAALEDEIMMPLSLALAQRCDACLRIGGASTGADAEVAYFRDCGKPVFFSLAEVPPPQGSAYV